jgi:hypothetical protein
MDRNDLIQRIGCDESVLVSNQIQSGFVCLPKLMIDQALLGNSES